RKFKNLIRYIEKIPFVEAEAEVQTVAENAVESMTATINSSRKRPDAGTHKLENAITIEELLNNPGRELLIGIGSLDRLTQEAPYWEVLDQGGYIPPANLGYFDGNPEKPTKGMSGQHWMHTGSTSDYLLTPKKPIQGIDYIGAGLRNLAQSLDKLVIDFGGKILDNMEKI
ncbi:MAG: hypothetical protein ACTSQJ_18555, partial [Promethearchaeota archaeon]